MILDENAVRAMAQQAADIGNIEQQIYQRKSGEYLFCAKGNFSAIKQYLPSTEQVRYLGSVRPSAWPKDEKV